VEVEALALDDEGADAILGGVSGRGRELEDGLGFAREPSRPE
jgi:hypothetical protein